MFDLPVLFVACAICGIVVLPGTAVTGMNIIIIRFAFRQCAAWASTLINQNGHSWKKKSTYTKETCAQGISIFYCRSTSFYDLSQYLIFSMCCLCSLILLNMCSKTSWKRKEKKKKKKSGFQQATRYNYFLFLLCFFLHEVVAVGFFFLSGELKCFMGDQRRRSRVARRRMAAWQPRW